MKTLTEPWDITDAALREAGRPDLCNELLWFQNDDGSWYAEYDETDMSASSLALIRKALALAGAG